MFEKIYIILLVNLIFYFKCLRYNYVSDDIPSSRRKEEHPKWKYWLLVLEGHLKSTPQIDHAITTFIHALVCVFIYTGFRSIEILSTSTDNVSFLAALLFCVNPINNQASVWISGRGYALSALGMTSAMTFPALGIIFLTLATYSNAGFLAPLCLIGSKFSWLLLFMPAVWFFHSKRFKTNVVNKMKMEMYKEDKRIHPIKLILAIKTFGFYLTHAIIPIKTTFYHSYFQSMAGCGKEKAYSFKDKFLWIGIITILCIIKYWITTQWNMVSFALLWWCVCLAPFCNLFRLQQEIGERYCYLPTIGLMIVLAAILQPYPLAISFFLGMYMTKLWFYADIYKDDYFLIEGSKLHSPDSWFSWHVAGMKRWDSQSHQEAVILWTMARMISPKEFKLNFNIATALKLAKHDKEALDFLKIAEDNIPGGQENDAGKLIDDWKKGQMTIIL